MAQVVVTGAGCVCSFGTAPGNFNATSQTKVMVNGKPAGTIKDTSMVSLPGFMMCTSMANPQVAAATAAAMGVLTPQPCMVQAAGTWMPKAAKVMVAGTPVLTNDSQLTCGNGMGQITFTLPGQTKTIIK